MERVRFMMDHGIGICAMVVGPERRGCARSGGKEQNRACSVHASSLEATIVMQSSGRFVYN